MDGTGGEDAAGRLRFVSRVHHGNYGWMAGCSPEMPALLQIVARRHHLRHALEHYVNREGWGLDADRRRHRQLKGAFRATTAPGTLERERRVGRHLPVWYIVTFVGLIESVMTLQPATRSRDPTVRLPFQSERGAGAGAVSGLFEPWAATR